MTALSTLVDLALLAELPSKVAKLEAEVIDLRARLAVASKLDPAELLTVAQAAAELRCSTAALHKKIQRGQIVAERSGRNVRVRRRELTR